MFKDRFDAGFQLADRLKAYKEKEDAIVMALPRGGVVTGYVVATALHLPLEVIMVKKIGHPVNEEYAIGAVSMTGRVLGSTYGVDPTYINNKTEELRTMLKERYKRYHGDRKPVSATGKTVIVVDDGVATGKTLMAALGILQAEHPKKIIVAVPVGPVDTIAQLKEYADEVICLEVHREFYAIGNHYKKFEQVTDEEVIKMLRPNTVNYHTI